MIKRKKISFRFPLKLASLSVVLSLVSISILSQPNQKYKDELLIKVNQSITLLRVNIKKVVANDNDSLKLLNLKKNLGRANILLNGIIDNMLKETTQHDSAYYQTLKEMSNYKDLFDLASQTNNIDSLDKLISFVESDLNLKCDPFMGSSSDNSPQLVTVHVRVFKKNSQDQLSGIVCKVKPEWSLDEDQIESFNPTNNAVKKISPGRKLFWIEDHGKIIQKKIDGIRITNDSETFEDFIIE